MIKVKVDREIHYTIEDVVNAGSPYQKSLTLLKVIKQARNVLNTTYQGKLKMNAIITKNLKYGSYGFHFDSSEKKIGDMDQTPYDGDRKIVYIIYNK